MGYSRIDVQRSLVTPDTPPPELEGINSSIFTFRAPEDPFRRPVAPISPPMSSYDHGAKLDMSAGKHLEEGAARRDAGEDNSRQLPSLSSIFGPQMRPLHSPHSERPSPLRSPLDRPASASASSDRSYSSSYFPSAPAPATHTYDPRMEPERASLPSVASRFPGPLSPRNREFEPVHAASYQDSASRMRWSSQSNPADPRRPEYVFGTREATSSFRASHDRYPLPPFSQKTSHHEPAAGYREQAGLPVVSSGHQPGPVAVGLSEGAPVKDGLGPKIWTGTHFLPRFVRQSEVPGEGLCYFYDDGTHCKSVIDGEQVNAHWGVTKAGKPRKRLAIACLTCREKKIKCDPDFPRCIQCEKFGRVCKFKNAPRGGQNTSPATSPGVLVESRQLGMEQRRPRSISSSSVSPRTSALPHPSPELPGMPMKRMRIGFEQYNNHPTTEPAHLYQPTDIKKTALPWHQRDLPRVHEDLLGRSWQSDPYVYDPETRGPDNSRPR